MSLLYVKLFETSHLLDYVRSTSDPSVNVPCPWMAIFCWYHIGACIVTMASMIWHSIGICIGNDKWCLSTRRLHIQVLSQTSSTQKRIFEISQGRLLFPFDCLISISRHFVNVAWAFSVVRHSFSWSALCNRYFVGWLFWAKVVRMCLNRWRTGGWILLEDEMEEHWGPPSLMRDSHL